MKTKKADIAAIVSAGTFAGAQMMIGVSFGMRWNAATGADLVRQFPDDWANIAAAIIPFALLQTIAIPLALYLSWENRPARRLWIAALACWLINCTITSAYHFPVVWASMHGGYSAAEMPATVEQWVLFHWIRIALGYGAFLFALLAAMRAAPPSTSA